MVRGNDPCIGFLLTRQLCELNNTMLVLFGAFSGASDQLPLEVTK